MSEFHEGRVAATHQLGMTVEDIKESYEKEKDNLEAMKVALAMTGKRLEDYHLQIKADLESARLTIKEAEVGSKYVTNCIDLVRQLFNDTEVKRLAALGGIEALRKVVADVKKSYDHELAKFKEIQSFEAKRPLDWKNRPVGYMPSETPLDEYKVDESSTPELVVPIAKKSKKSKTTGA